MNLSIDISSTGSVTVLGLLGDHDIATAVELRRAVADSRSTLTVIDLAACTFLDSTVIGVLVSGSKRHASEGRNLILVNAHGLPARALSVVGADKVLQTFPLAAHLPPQPRLRLDAVAL